MPLESLLYPSTTEATDHSGLSYTHFLARQPILDAHRQVIGYELLSRSGWENFFRGEADDATRKLVNHCVMMGIETLTSNCLAFVNCTREALVTRLVTVLPPATTVIEILETVEPDAEVVAACRELREMGYALALDDFMPREEMRPLVEIANFVKIDFRLSDRRMRKQIRDMVRGTGAVLLAEKVEDQEEFRMALAEGCEYFQGYFFCRPTMFANRVVPRSRMN